MSLAAGTRLGPYEIEAALGAGGMGEVYRARDTRLDRTVAIKILPETLAADPQFRERFDREARAISSLNHPHICTVHDIGRQTSTSTGQPVDYLVMECLEGETLAARLERGAVPVAEALQMAIQIADALVTAHRAGVIHRDLKPGNIFLVGKRGSSGDGRRGGPSASAEATADRRSAKREGWSGPPTAKLLDFGLAKTAAPAVSGAGLSMLPTTPPSLTGQGTILGTFQYMAPEQVEGGEADARTDIFAFGAVLYEMLTGRKAFEGKSHASLIGAIMHAEPAPVSSVQPLATRAVDRVVRKCLAKDPDDRWQTARDLLDELKWIAEAGEQPITASSSDTASSATVASVPRRTMWRRVVLVGAMTLVLGASFATSLTWLLTRPSPPLVARLTLTTPSTAALTIDGVLRDLDHWSPEVLPGGRSVLFTIPARTGGFDAAQVAVLDLQTGVSKVLVRGGSHGHYVASGHLVYGAAGTLRAVAFDLARLETRGTPVPVVPDILTTASGAVDAVVANDGTLTYVSGGLGTVQRTLVWVDRQGQEASIPVPPRPYLYPRITPDGRRIALYAADQENDTWLWDVARTTLTRVTFEPRLRYLPGLDA